MTVEQWRERARRRLPRFAFDYLEGGADNESGLRRNQAAFERLMLVPERLRDVTQCSLTTRLFGVDYPSPLVVAPLGLNSLFWGNGDVALAQAAQRAGVPFVLSTASNVTVADLATQVPAPHWFQLYVLEDRGIAERLLAAARADGYRVLVLTVDVPVNGNRVRDARNGFGLPLRMSSRLILDTLSHPRWLAQLARHGVPQLVNMQSDSTSASARARAALIKRSTDRSLTWKSLDWLRSHWPGPIVIKGLLSPQDARRACDCGVAGIVVSNHGGRQLDAAPASIDVLADIVDAVDARIDVLLDSGIRCGSDVIRALALGAKAVMVGRPLLYGLAAAGEAGAYAVLNHLMTETARTLTLTGVSSIEALNRGHVMSPAVIPAKGAIPGSDPDFHRQNDRDHG